MATGVTSGHTDGLAPGSPALGIQLPHGDTGLVPLERDARWGSQDPGHAAVTAACSSQRCTSLIAVNPSRDFSCGRWGKAKHLAVRDEAGGRAAGDGRPGLVLAAGATFSHRLLRNETQRHTSTHTSTARVCRSADAAMTETWRHSGGGIRCLLRTLRLPPGAAGAARPACRADQLAGGRGTP